MVMRRIITVILAAVYHDARGGGATMIASMSLLLLLLLISPVTSWTTSLSASTTGARHFYCRHVLKSNPQQRRSAVAFFHSPTTRTNFFQNHGAAVVVVAGVRIRVFRDRRRAANTVLLQESLFDDDGDHGAAFSSLSLSSSSSSSSSLSSIVKTTALAIVPPEDAWDTIQRARYMAGDPSYQQWPPCLRLFCYHHHDQQNDGAGKSSSSSSTTTGAAAADPGVMQRITDDPLQIAAVVEKYNIAPFTVRLNRWTILPHAEVILHEKQQQQQHLRAAAAAAQSTATTGTDSLTTAPLSEFEKLVAQEEAIGRRNLKKRLQRKAEAAAAATAAAATTTTSTQPSASADANDDEHLQVTATPFKNKKDRKQNKKKESSSSSSSSANDNNTTEAPTITPFNGPCVICLEPDTGSKRRISKLRFRILQELVIANKRDDNDDNNNSNTTTSKKLHLQHVCSPTATVTPLDIISRLDAATSAATVTAAVASVTPSSSSEKKMRKKKAENYPGYPRGVQGPHDDAENVDDKYYRPVVPIGSFPTVQQAVAVLGHLQALWDPLEFRVTDLQVVSCLTTLATNTASIATRTTRRTCDALFSSSPAGKKQEQQEQVGCDALIMLQGEEVFMDAKLNAEMANFIATRGQMGGHEAAASAAVKQGHVGDGQGLPLSPATERIRIDDLDLADGDVSSLQKWLWQDKDDDNYDDVGGVNHLDSLDQDDEDYDEGTVVVLGRTHFFTGDMRTYVGMPAESIPLRGSSSNRAEKKSSTNPTAQAIAAAAAINDNKNGSWTSSTSNGTIPVP
jgi:hypothetical protein